MIIVRWYLRIIESLNDEINTKTILGVGYYSALLIVGEVGNISRFPDSYHLCSYACLVASTRSSGGSTYHGSITKTGSKCLRWIMLECVYACIRNEKNSNIAQFYYRISKKKGNSKAGCSCCFQIVKGSLLDYEGKTNVREIIMMLTDLLTTNIIITVKVLITNVGIPC